MSTAVLQSCRVLTNFVFADELMSNLQQVKRIVQAKWNKSTGSDSNHSQEELTQEAEKILKKTQSKTNISPLQPSYMAIIIRPEWFTRVPRFR